jgi:hypothetical protein
VAFNNDRTALYVYTTDSTYDTNTERVYKITLSSMASAGTFVKHSNASNTFASALAVMPDDTVLTATNGAGTTTGERCNKDLSSTDLWSTTVGSSRKWKKAFYLKDNLAVLVGGSSGGGDNAYVISYITGTNTATFNCGGQILGGTQNLQEEMLLVSTALTDEDADGSYNLRVSNDDFTSMRKLLVGSGAQLDDVLALNPSTNRPIQLPPTPSGYRALRQLVAFGNDEVWYESSEGTMSEVTAANGDVDTSGILSAAEAYEKVFVANDTKLKVLDMKNVKIQDGNGFTNVPDFGDILTQGSSQLVVDYVDSTAATPVLYGKVVTGTFVVTTAILNATQGNEQVFPSPEAPVSPPHWYDWTPFDDDAQTATYGTMPNRSYLVCNYRGRLVLAGNSQYPHQWYMSRQANPWDWKYFANDAQSAVSGSNADAGEIGDIITCLAPLKDDYVIMGCVRSIYVMRGDPAAGGSLDELSLTTGIFGSQSFCFDALDNFYFLGSNGICRIPSNLSGIENLSEVTLPNLINDLGISPRKHRITLGYDREREGILVSITELYTGTNTNYWFSLKTRGFFPESYGINSGIFSQHFYEAVAESYRKLLVGGADGYIRVFDDEEKNDDDGAAGSVAIDSYVTIGPAQIGQDADQRGRLKTLSITTSTDTDGVDYDIHVAKSAEEVVDDVGSGATPLHTGTISAGNRVQTLRPRARGAWLGIKLQNDTASETWQFEKLVADIKPAGDIK